MKAVLRRSVRGYVVSEREADVTDPPPDVWIPPEVSPQTLAIMKRTHPPSAEANTFRLQFVLEGVAYYLSGGRG